VEESSELIMEMLQFSGRKLKSKTNESSIDSMDISTLRKKLEEAELDVHGSREALVERLKYHNQLQQYMSKEK